MVTNMWDYCEMCARIFLMDNLQQCDYCGEFYCGQCNPVLDNVIVCPAFGDNMTFCSIVCSDAYRAGFRRSRRSRKRKRGCDSSDSE